MRIELYERPLHEDFDLKLSSVHEKNLRNLADYLKALPAVYAGFDMGTYQRVNYECTTIACAAGHGPMAGIGQAPSANVGWQWEDYILENFGVGGESVSHNLLWVWLFGGVWQFTDNTPYGAAARIEWFLKFGGIPCDVSEQVRRLLPLSYEIIQD